MNVNKNLLIGLFATLTFGVAVVSASSYYSMYDLHQRMLGADSFEQMHSAMMGGDFDAAEKYHESLDFDCPMHDLVKDGDVSLSEFQQMHQWMMTGGFPQEKPDWMSDAAWEIHVSHHPEIYGP